MDGGGRRRREACTVVACSTPQRIVARWFSGLRKDRHWREDDAVLTGCSTNCLNHCEMCRRDASFDVGIRCFLFYLITAGKNELNKMVELRRQMEMLLENAKEELQRKELQAKPLKHTTIDGHGDPESNNHQISPQVVLASFSVEDSSASMVCDQTLKHDVSESKQSPVDQIDSEPEGKPEHLHIDAEASKKYREPPKDRKLKFDNKGESHKLVAREVKDEVIYQHGGVCPYELERELHQLLETRQQEQIQKLEAAVRWVQRRLHEKETEVSWWKDAACLLSKRFPESCRTGLERWVPKSSRTGLELVSKSCGTGLESRIPGSYGPGSEPCDLEASRTGLEHCVPEARSLS